MLAFFAVLGGLLCDSLGYLRTASIAAILMCLAGVLRAFSQGFLQLFFLTMLMGTGIALLIPNLPKIVKQTFPPDKVDIATGIYVTGACVGASIALASSETLLHLLSMGWRGVLLLFALICIAPSAGMILKLRGIRGGKSASLQGLKEGFLKVLKHRDVLLAAALAFCTQYSFYTVTGWYPSILSMKGEPEAIASLLTLTFPSMPLAAFLSNKIGKRKPFLYLPCMLQALLVQLIYYLRGAPLYVATIALGVCFNVPFSFLFLLPTELVDESLIGSATGIILTVGYMGGILGPFISGVIRDFTMTFSWSFLITSIVIFSGGVLALFIRRVK